MILERFRLDDRVALVTGGNRGLGTGMAAALAEAGADVVAVQRSSEAPALADRVEAAGRSLLPLALDLADSGSDRRPLVALARASTSSRAGGGAGFRGGTISPSLR